MLSRIQTYPLLSTDESNYAILTWSVYGLSHYCLHVVITDTWSSSLITSWKSIKNLLIDKIIDNIINWWKWQTLVSSGDRQSETGGLLHQRYGLVNVMCVSTISWLKQSVLGHKWCSLLLKLMITDKLKMSHFRMTSFLYREAKEGHQSQGWRVGHLRVFLVTVKLYG